jgi:hypothetical protein
MPDPCEPDSPQLTLPLTHQSDPSVAQPSLADPKGENFPAQPTEASEAGLPPPLPTDQPTGSEVQEDSEEWEESEPGGDVALAEEPGGPVTRVRRRRRQPRVDAAELRLRGRRTLCKRFADIAPHMLKTVKLRVLGRYLQSTRGLEDDDLTQVIKKEAAKLAERARILAALRTPDTDFNRGQLKAILFTILLQEETHSIDENRLDEKVIEFEKDLVKRSKTLDFDELKKQDPDQWHHLDTYRIVLEAAWSNDDLISPDEARLLAVLRSHLGISMEEHWLISALLKRFPKEKCVLHTPDEINEARKELQREGLLWGYRDENNRNIDVIPAGIAAVIRREFAGQELQRTNYRRLMNHDGIMLNDLRGVLQKRGLSRYGNKPELIERIVLSDIKPSEVLADLEREKLSSMCGGFGLKSSGNKAELIERLIDFYDDLKFEERVTKDEREVWYNNYELLASRAYAELRAKKIITKDVEIEHLFEHATAFLFEARLHVACDRSQKDNRADGRLPLD